MRNHSVLVAAVVLGFAASAHAAPTAQQLEEHRALLKTQVHALLPLTHIVRDPLLADPAVVFMQRDLRAPLKLLEKPNGRRLEMRDDGVWYASPEDHVAPRRADLEDLLRIGVKSVDEFHALVTARLHERTRVPPAAGRDVALRALFAKMYPTDTSGQLAASYRPRQPPTEVTWSPGPDVARGEALVGWETNGLTRDPQLVGFPMTRHPSAGHVVHRVHAAVGTDGDAFLESALRDPVRLNGDLGLVRAVRVTLGKDHEPTPSAIVLARDGNRTLMVVQRTTSLLTVRPDGEHVQLAHYLDKQRAGGLITHLAVSDHLEVVEGPTTRDATLADLHAFGIHGKADFDHAAAVALFEFAPEDLPSAR